MAEASLPLLSPPAVALRFTLLLPFEAVAAARGHLLPFAGVGYGTGIGLWFAWSHEPAFAAYGAAIVLVFAGACIFLWAGELARPWGALALSIAAGFLVAGLRAQMIAAPMLGFHYYGPVQGRLIEIDRSGSDALRLTLDRVVLERLAPQKTPVRIRVSLHGAQHWHAPAVGETLILTAHLAAPEGPVEPGGFDFRRMAFFEQLGAVGYSRTPVLLLEPPAPGDAWIGRLRARLSGGIRQHIAGEAGAFAAGAMTGDRSGISQETAQALRDSSLAHILAISGMNLAFLIGFLFGLIRGAVALVPPLALRLNAKKVAAVVSLAVALFYLLLSGANVATERAFYMVTVMLGAVLLDRRAITLRSAALAGMLLLTLHPESLTEPGFQMSFAATVALIAGFQALDGVWLRQGRWPFWALTLFTSVASTVIGGFATAPYAAAHFNRFADYGLLANLLTVPAMGLAIMPMGVLAVLLAPIGLAGLPLWVMGKAAEWILYVAHRIAAFEGAVTGIAAPAPWALPLISLAGLWLILWPGRARLAGVAGIALGVWLWPQAPRPDMIVASDGRLLAVMGAQGRALSASRGGGFAARNWLENDGDLVTQEVAAARPGFSGPKEARAVMLGGLRIVALSGEAAAAGVTQACAAADLVILAQPAAEDLAPAGCAVWDQKLLRQTGALAFHRHASGIDLQVTRSAGRIWDGGAYDRAALEGILPKGVAISGAE